MNSKNLSHQEWPDELQKAVYEYPRIVASPDFNQRVFAALAEKQAQQNKIDAFCDALDRIFERPLLKLLGTALFAISLAWGGSNLILKCTGGMPKTNATTLPFEIDEQLDGLPPHLANLYAQQPEFGLHFSPSNNALSAPATKVLSSDKKETSCSPNETILWG